MKKTLITLLGIIVAPLAFAQGSFNANNFAGQGEIRVGIAGQPLAGAEYMVQLFWGATGTAQGALTAWGSPVAVFGTTGGDLGTGAGWFDLGQIDLFPGSGPADVSVQIRAWRNDVPSMIGYSAIVTQPLAYGQSFPTDLASIGTVLVPVPEPSSFALAGLAGAAMMVLRRRK